MVLSEKFLYVLLLSLCALPVQAADPQILWKKLLGKSPGEQTEWAARYEHGEGVPRNYTLAMRLYCAAARRGHAPAQYQLGWMYANGRGVQRDDLQAAAWFRLAAARGDAHAGRMLAYVEVPGRPRQPPRCIGEPQPRPQLAAKSPARRHIEALVRRLAPEYGLDPALVLAVIEAESSFRVNARSPKDAQGLMQLIPATAERFGVRDIMDPVQNLRGGMAYLRWLLAYFQGDVRLALAGYNAGEGAVLEYSGVPPYAETRAYVKKIVKAYGRHRHPPVAAVVEPARLLAAVAAP